MVSSQNLKEFELFQGLDDSALAKLVELCHERSFEDGALCFVQGKKAIELHLCRSGKVDIMVKIYEPWSAEVTTYTAMAGEAFGWSALIETNVYTASAKCVGKVEEIYITRRDLIKLFTQNHYIGYVVMRNLIKVMNSRLIGTREKFTKLVAAASHQEW